MNLQEAIALFLEDGRVRALSPQTLKLNRIFCERFAGWAESRGALDIRDVRLEHLLEFRRHLDGLAGKSQGPGRRLPAGRHGSLSIVYRNRHARCVRLLFQLLYRRGLILSDLASRIPPYRDPKRLPRGLMDKDQVGRLLRAADLGTPTGFRDRAIYETLYSTGMRGGELCRLTLYEVNLTERTLRIIEGKGRKDRLVPLGRVAAGYLAEYLRAVRPILLGRKETPAVFVTARGEPFKPLTLRHRFAWHRERAGLSETITVHSLRHACATEMLKGGASIRHVQELLGHASLATTQVYTHVVQADLKRVHARTAPSERRRVVEAPSFAAPAPPWNDPRNARYWPLVHRSAAGKRTEKQGATVIK